ncbi:hypothetical protein RRG08_061691 [Elysia crispata]|uniref:Uncharacterized protein n=1 Tax=Elysia crispata TaxID=231223 RepID=A0AAE0XNX2_9GAST|nr:hypothetical protein RRG08_061691 [Elysia crispata]
MDPSWYQVLPLPRSHGPVISSRYDGGRLLEFQIKARFNAQLRRHLLFLQNLKLKNVDDTVTFHGQATESPHQLAGWTIPVGLIPRLERSFSDNGHLGIIQFDCYYGRPTGRGSVRVRVGRGSGGAKLRPAGTGGNDLNRIP